MWTFSKRRGEMRESKKRQGAISRRRGEGEEKIKKDDEEGRRMRGGGLVVCHTEKQTLCISGRMQN